MLTPSLLRNVVMKSVTFGAKQLQGENFWQGTVILGDWRGTYADAPFGYPKLWPAAGAAYYQAGPL
jgi:hypothetical protein